MKNYYTIIAVLSLALTCCKKKDKSEISVPQIIHKEVNTILAYNQHLNLDVNGDGKSDFYFVSVLVMENNIASLYLLVNPDDSQGCKIIVSKEPQLVLSGLWATPFTIGSSISANPAAGYEWNSFLNSGFIISSADNGQQKQFSGPWIARQNYLAIQFRVNNRVHYGWVRLSNTGGKEQVLIHDFAYNNVPEQEIRAGEQ